MEEIFPFAESNELSNDIEDLKNPIPFTLVNNIPMDGTNFIAPYVAVPESVAIEAIKFANLNNEDCLVDLGCGDGRILYLAHQEVSGLKSFGVELDPYLAMFASNKVKNLNCIIIEKNMFEVNLLELKATCLILYLLPLGLEKLKSNLKEWFEKENTSNFKRIVTINYKIPDCEHEFEKCVISLSNSYNLFSYQNIIGNTH
ncbi:hypothetical protein HK099_005687 [Clydaea vesicula]|uniref:Methyltransferase domain-containing protein n=1 Tax=Clydaea vesicula TaxID=447962 RepID=A0AAD5TYW4_9FUNG|nr:hypothetical protein HK099_005687 [Clydaea vesicula]